MRVLALILEKLANLHNFAILTTNHLAASIQNKKETEDAALGTTWESMVCTKLKVKNTTQYSSSRVRQIEVVCSPRLANGTAQFLITGNGVANK